MPTGSAVAHQNPLTTREANGGETPLCVKSLALAKMLAVC